MDRNEALKVIKDNWTEGRHQLSEALKTLIPELNESEDERIRKSIIRLIQRGGYMSPEDKDKAYAWLEKQGQKFIDGTFVNVDEVRENFINEVYRVLDSDPNNDRANQIIDAFDSLPTIVIENQGEQKPAWSEEDKNCEKISEYTTVEKDMDEYNKGFECGKQRVLKYPEDFGLCEKPVWSKEDEEMFDAIIADIQFTQKAHTHEVNQVVYEREIDWLKSLKERVQTQPKQNRKLC